MKKNIAILVTGATGLVGAYVLRYLAQQGYTNLTAFCRPESNKALLADIENKFQYAHGDLLYLDTLDDAIDGVECVIHCAAMVSYDGRDRKKMMQTNVEGTANVVNICLEKNVKKLLHVSSIAAIGKTKNQAIINEKSPWINAPKLTQYAISKYLSEQEVWRGAAEGLEVAIVNPSIILGSGFWNRSSTALFQQVWDGLHFYPIGATAFVDVRDVARFIVQLMESNVCNERFILAAENLSFQTVFTKIAVALGKKPPTFRVTPFLRGLAWRLEWIKSRFNGKKILLTKETAEVSSKNHAFDNKKSTQTFDFQYISIDETIRETAEQMTEAAQNNFAPKILFFK